ncbi:MAG: FAD-binding oxidoreductase [Gammaproteobacteria bacterium]|nr:FAD-binding oxidoreductase [Gammaproteobacteria bacterium]
MTRPSGIDARSFAAALNDFAAVVGPDWVFADADDVATYRDAYTPFRGEPEREIVASAAVAPASVEEVQAVVRIANRARIPLYPISSGRNLAYGGSAPVQSGCVVLDLKRMNRILEVSEDHASALVEPGVSYFDLYRHIRERDLKLWVDAPDPGWGSLIGNALDHGAGRTQLPYRDHYDAHCGMEVVLADGTLVRTGMGALPGARTWQQFRYGAGPFVDGLFSQANFGIVTKMGFWLMPEPEACLVARIRCRRHDDAIPLVRILAHLGYSGVLNCHFPVLSPPFLAPLDARKAALLDQPDGGSAADWDRFAAGLGTHFWQTELRFFGPENVIRAQWLHARERLAVIPDIQLEEQDFTRFPLTEEQIATTPDLALFGIPNLAVFSSLANSTGHLDCSMIIPFSGAALIEGHKVFAQAYRRAGIVHKLGFALTYHWRSFIMFQGLWLTNDAAENARLREMYVELARMGAERGWGVYRAHAAFMDPVMETYSFNDHSLLRLHERIKDALDPNGILAPGRYGIWPRAQRKVRS